MYFSIFSKIIFLILFVNFFDFSFNKKPLVIIPFYKKNLLETEGADIYAKDGTIDKIKLFTVYKNNVINTELNLGNPIQKLKLNINFANHFSFVVGENYTLNGMGEVLDITPFKASLSSTYYKKEDVQSINQLMKNSNYMEDISEIGNSGLMTLRLIEGKDFTPGINYFTDSGAIGFGLNNQFERDANVSQISNFMMGLKQKELITSYNFFILYRNSTYGVVIMGGEPNDYNSKTYPNIIDSYGQMPAPIKVVEYGFSFDSIKYNGTEVPVQYYKANVAIEFAYIQLTYSFKKILDESFFNEYKEKGICEEVNVNFYSKDYICKKNQFDKKKLSTLTIYSYELNQTLELNLQELFYDFKDYSLFLCQFIELDSPTSISLKFGEPFFKKNILVFNTDRKTIGVYNTNGSHHNTTPEVKNNVNVYLILIIITIFLIIILAIVFYFYRIKRRTFRKRRLGELIEDDYEYIEAKAVNGKTMSQIN